METLLTMKDCATGVISITIKDDKYYLTYEYDDEGYYQGFTIGLSEKSAFELIYKIENDLCIDIGSK